MQPIGPQSSDVIRNETHQYDGPFEFLDAKFYVTLSGKNTDGQICAIDTIRHARGGPPLHIHHEQDEWFLIREGEFDIRVGDTTHHLVPGDSLYAPRGIPHCFANTTPAARMTVSFVPAGTMEEFFFTASKITSASPPEFAAIFGDFGMQVVGPPLPVN